MNVTISGYITFKCNSCSKSHTLESQSYQFTEDASAEAEEDDYIRYLAKLDTPCSACTNRISINVDVWEYPASVVNYCYYAENGAHAIQCEFSIEHYFDDQSMTADESAQEQSNETDRHPEFTAEPDDADDAPPPIEAYMDRYDDED